MVLITNFCTAIVVAIAIVGTTSVHCKTLLVANKLSLSVSLIDDDTGTTIKEISIGKSEIDTPHEIATSPQGTWALVSHYGKVSFNFSSFSFNNFRHPGSALSVIDVRQGTVARRIELPRGSSPHGIQFLSETQALVTAEGLQSLLLVDFTDLTNYQVSFFPIPGQGAHLLVVDATNTFAYVANKDSGSVVKFDIRARRAVKEQQIGRHAEGIALTNDGALLLVTDRLSNLVRFLDAETLAMKSHLKTESGPIRVSLFDNGKSALVTNSVSGTAQRVSLTTKSIVKGFDTTTTFSKETGKWCESLFGLLTVPVTMLVRDDQNTAYIANSYAGNISLVNIKTGVVLNTLTAGKEPDGMAISALDLAQPAVAN